RQALSPERARVGAGAPVRVDLGLVEVHRDPRSVAAEPLREVDDVRIQTHADEAEDRARPATPGLDVVDDEERPDVAGELLHRVQPLRAVYPHATFGLHR